MMEYDQYSQLIAIHSLSWLLCAKQRLCTREFIAAVTVGCKRVDNPALGFQSSADTLTVEELVDICSNLVVFDEESDSFRVAHLSVREYFENKPELGSFDIHSRALETCVCTLMYYGVRHPLQRYSWAQWSFHAVELGDGGPVNSTREIVKDFLHGNQGSFLLKWASSDHQSFMNMELDQSLVLKKVVREILSGPVGSFFAACIIGLLWVLFDLDKSPHFDFEGENATKGLILASKWGRAKIINFLIAKGVPVDSAVNGNETPLYHAVRRTQMQSVLTLLKHGANVDSECRGSSILQHAINSGNCDIVETLIRHKCETGKPWSSDFFETLMVPSYLHEDHAGSFYLRESYDSREMLTLLMDRGLVGNNLLFSFTKNCNLAALEYLLDAGMDPNIPEETGKRVFDFALEIGSDDILHILASKGAKPALYVQPSFPGRGMAMQTFYQLPVNRTNMDMYPSPRLCERCLDGVINVPVCQGSILVASGKRTGLIVFENNQHYFATYHNIPYLKISIPRGVYIDRIVCYTKSRDIDLSLSYPREKAGSGFQAVLWSRDGSEYFWDMHDNIDQSKEIRIQTSILHVPKTYRQTTTIEVKTVFRQFLTANWVYGINVEVYGNRLEPEGVQSSNR